MNFVSFEDETELFEAVLFPNVFERYRRFLFGQKPLVITGKIQNDQGALIVEVFSISPVI